MPGTGPSAPTEECDGQEPLPGLEDWGEPVRQLHAEISARLDALEALATTRLGASSDVPIRQGQPARFNNDTPLTQAHVAAGAHPASCPFCGLAFATCKHRPGG